MTQALVKGLVESQRLAPDRIFVSNRSPGKLQKLSDQFKIQACSSNEQVIEKSDVLVIAVKPQDLIPAIEPLSQIFLPEQIVVSLAAGIPIKTLEKSLPQTRVVRVIPNTPALIGKGITGYVLGSKKDVGLEATIEDLFSCLGKVYTMQDEEQLESFMVACSSGVGFLFELMTYWQDWLEERGFEPQIAKEMTTDTFLGTSLLAQQSPHIPYEELQARVTSKKGVTIAGLDSMRELEIERALRVSFEKAAMRNQELSKIR